MTRTDILSRLRAWVAELALDPYDAALIATETAGYDDLTVEDLAEHCEMQGYPNLAAELVAA